MATCTCDGVAAVVVIMSAVCTFAKESNEFRAD